MAKFWMPDKFKLVGMLLFLLQSPICSAEAVPDLIENAKKHLLEGRRKEALEELERAKKLTKSRQTLREIQEKHALFIEQFLTSKAFQTYQEAKGFSEAERWPECLRELDGIPAGDLENILVLRLRALCLDRSGALEEASKTLQKVIALDPTDAKTAFSFVEVSLAQKKYAESLAALQGVEPKTSEEHEKYAVLKAKLLVASGKIPDAIEVLKQDQEKHMEHVQVLFELGRLYAGVPGNDWSARKFLSLFITRCKRMSSVELKSRKLDVLLPEAQSKLSELDSKLGV